MFKIKRENLLGETVQIPVLLRRLAVSAGGKEILKVPQ